MKDGSQPLNINAGPSALTAVVKMLKAPELVPWAFIIRVFTTSAGEHTVVATNPAINEALKCVDFFSESIERQSTRKFFEMS